MISLSGKGIHSGRECTVKLHRSSGPVTFLRSGHRIPATVDYVSDTRSATSLTHAGASVRMVEHLLAALHMRNWWTDLLIEVSHDELPILDGSASGWLAALDALGAPPPAPAALEFSTPVTVRAAGGTAGVSPGNDFLHCSIDFPHPLIGRQSWQGGPDSYTQLADARTFGFAADIDRLRQQGLALGASADNCVAFTAAGTMTPLRGPDEPARHKALDALGDLFLLGQPLRGRISTACGSHTLHARLVQELRQNAGLETAG